LLNKLEAWPVLSKRSYGKWSWKPYNFVLLTLWQNWQPCNW